jgi:hypothetical protein
MRGRTQLGFVAAGLTLAWGFFGLVDPLVVVRIVGLEVVEPRGLSEVRALMGALFVVMGGIMLWAASSRSAPRAYLRLPGLLILAEAAGRLASIVIDNVVSPGNFVFLLVELIIGTLAVVASFPGAAQAGGGRPPASDDDRPDPMRAYRG